MSLADLKKQRPTKTKRTFTVDEFIDGATNYATGNPEFIDADMHMQAQTELLSRKIAEKIEPCKDKPFKRATFTLSEDIISQLNELSAKTSISKSRLLRILVNNFYYLENPNELIVSKVK
ncbi:ribbon-helix-helix domain-containing protein [Thalassotalea sp. ND16A]|uniref:ribbon-helix-helix domain-containing protein n=1 Tax=Thalassotalea sp. ND16A TaxID=1535422 RepID=UPI00051D20A8|nr:ribbon-helix-helix domain-containing protein [Thalassotalea sp. ND16A]KGJ87468.1 hypothetical protein ND16A_2851 [Thalassotalea sp. ND16A]